jgi:chromosomal replication initiator protein
MPNPYTFPGLKGAKIPVQLFVNKTPPDDIIKIACRVLCVEIDDFLSKNRKKEISEARHIVSYLLVKKLGITLEKTGAAYLGNRDHTTVINSLRKFNNLYDTEEDFRNKVHIILDNINV